ncbi:MAG: hypothetical protein JRF63_10630 [Deltaproteobacteria bacterium]|nr:hypothetical protein [Deltaproteobacteria bacterium]
MTTQTEAQTERNYRTISTSRQFVDQEDLTVMVRFALGRITLGRDQGSVLYRSRLVYDEDLFEPVQRYDRARRTLEITLEGREGRDFKGRDLENLEQRLDVALSPSVPARIDLEFGAVSADLDLGGLWLIEADIKTGASKSVLRFSRPTIAPCERLSVVMGAAQFEAQQLGNANCQIMQFEGAAGAFTLDFTGEWQHEGETAAKVEFGVGALTLRFPAHLGVAISLDRFLATFERSGFVQRDGVFYSSNYDSATAKLRLDIDAAFGDIDVEWVPR